MFNELAGATVNMQVVRVIKVTIRLGKSKGVNTHKMITALYSVWMEEVVGEQYIKTGNYLYEKMWTRFKYSKVRDMPDHAPATVGDHSGFRVGRGV